MRAKTRKRIGELAHLHGVDPERIAMAAKACAGPERVNLNHVAIIQPYLERGWGPEGPPPPPVCVNCKTDIEFVGCWCNAFLLCSGCGVKVPRRDPGSGPHYRGYCADCDAAHQRERAGRSKRKPAETFADVLPQEPLTLEKLKKLARELPVRPGLHIPPMVAGMFKAAPKPETRRALDRFRTIKEPSQIERAEAALEEMTRAIKGPKTPRELAELAAKAMGDPKCTACGVAVKIEVQMSNFRANRFRVICDCPVLPWKTTPERAIAAFERSGRPEPRTEHPWAPSQRKPMICPRCRVRAMTEVGLNEFYCLCDCTKGISPDGEAEAIEEWARGTGWTPDCWQAKKKSALADLALMRASS